MSACTAAIQMDVDTYRKTDFGNPEPHFLDGELEPRILGEFDHSYLTLKLIQMVLATGLLPMPEIRVRITPSRIRTAELAVITKAQQRIKDRYGELTSAVATFEILSPGQSANSKTMHALFADYATLGISPLMLVDPEENRLWNWSMGRFYRYTQPTVRLYDSDANLIATLIAADLWKQAER